MLKEYSTGKYETIKIRPEDELLLCCARTKVDPEIRGIILFLVYNKLDWNYLLKSAFKHRLIHLLYYNLNSICPELVPEDILSKLRHDSHVDVRKNLMITGELINVLNLLDSKGITAVPYKGPVLALMAYGNIGLRQFNDIDIFVREVDFLTVKNLMISEGYQLFFNETNMSDFFYLKTQRECLFANKNSEVIIEIQWNSQGSHISIKNSQKLLYDLNELIKININGQNIPSFSPENLLLILCLHNAKHDWEYIALICDISELIQSNNINWQQVMEKADKLSIKRILFINLFLAKDIFGLELPDKVLNYIASDSWAIQLSFQLKKILFNQNSLNIFEKFFFDLRKRENRLDAVNDCIKSLISPSYADFEDISLPKFLFPLYYLIRPILLLKRYGKDPL